MRTKYTTTLLKRLGAWALTLALVVGLLPQTAFATGTDTGKAIQLGTSGISDPTSTQNSKGRYYTPSDYVYFGVKGSDPIKWRVLDADKTNDGTTSGMFLLSEYLLDSGVMFESAWNYNDNDGQTNPNEWQHSDAQNWCSTFATNTDVFSTAEQAAFLGVTKTDTKGSLYSLQWGTSSLTENDKVFFLSVRELADYVGSYDDAPGLRATDTAQRAGSWWLRSPYADTTDCAGLVDNCGGVYLDYVNLDWAARPAFNVNLNSVLFTSAAVGGKSSGTVGADALQSVSEYTGNEWKLTLLDDEHKNFEISNATINGDGDTIAFSYSGAQTGTNEYISVVIEDSGAITHYGRILQPESASGTASLTLPAGIALNGNTKLYIFNEQYNGDKMTDYASQLKEISNPTVDTTAPTLTAGAVSRTSDTEATVKFMSGEAGMYYYEVVESGAATPTISTSGTGATCDTSEQTISLTTLTAGAKDIYIIVKDAAGNVSNPALKMTIPVCYAVTVDVDPSGGGTASAVPSAAVEGDEVELTATPGDGYHFKEWEVTPNTVSIGTDNKFTMPASDVTVKAVFAAHEFSNWTANGNGTHTGTCSCGTTETQSCTYGDNGTCTVCGYVDVTTTDPANSTVKEGETATFTVTATGNDISYQWQIKTASESNWANIDSATGSSYTTPAATMDMDGYQYRCVVSNNAGDSATSNPATLTVNKGASVVTPSNSVGYFVEHYKKDPTTGDYALADQDFLMDEIGQTVTATAKTYTGYSRNPDAEGTVESGKLKEIKSEADIVILKLYYDPDTYNVYFNANGGSINGEAVSSYTYGVGAALPDNVTREGGYNFGGWYESDTFSGSPVTEITATDTGEKTYFAKWISTSAGVESVSVKGTAGAVNGTEIAVVLPFGTALATDSDDVSITPADGAAVSGLQLAESDGSKWTFTVTAEDGSTMENYTINVSIAADPAEGNRAAIAAAKSAIESRAWTVAQATANTEADVKAWVENQLAGLEALSGVTYSVTMDSGFTAAVQGTRSNRQGTNGSFGFTVSLSIGNDTGNVADSTYAADTAAVNSGAITATAYTGGSGGGSTGGSTGGGDDEDSEGASTNPPAASLTVPVSGSQNTIHVDVSVDGATATIDRIDSGDLHTVIGDHVQTGVVTIDFSGLDTGLDTVKLPADVVKQIAAAANAEGNDAESLEIVLPGGTSIEFDADALGEKSAQANGLDVTISIKQAAGGNLTASQQQAVGGRTAYDINVTSGGVHISDMGGQVTVHAPYALRSGERAEGIVVYYVASSGSRERCETSYDSARQRVNWKTDHLSVYMIGYEEPSENPETGGDATPTIPSTGDNPYVTYTVQRGDTLWAISRRYGCTVAEIVAANSELIKNPNLIYPGWQLQIPQGGAAGSQTPENPDALLPDRKYLLYTVQRGDTLWAISRKYGCTVSEIVALNGELIKNPDLIFAGWELKIPQD